ncbi:MAG: ABC transporter substrate-binding protein [Negativibacillus massiliensis]|uniref:peptide ABC transporter substrate-binding protein n=1 Tax=Negativibacillus massiliensis TaxID=1871035 RepID=UPI0039A06228
MKKTISRGLALLLASMLVLSGCGSTGTTNETSNEPNSEGETTGQEQAESTETASSENEIKDLVISQLGVNEMETFNILFANNQKEHDVLCNVWEGLLETDTHGKLAPCIATEWGTEDGGLNWTFKLREDSKWVDMNGQEKAACNAQDFATGLEWVLNFHKNDSSNTSMPIEMIKGAEEYYEYTKTLTPEEAKALTAGEGSKFREMVGLETPDDYTVIYHCTDPKPYFDSVAAYVCLFPLSQAMVDELGGVDAVRAMDNTTMWYNGPYTMTTYVQNNEKVFTKNPTYWDTECKLFDTVTTKMVESNDVAFQLYQNGEIDEVALSESNISTIRNNENDPFYNYMVEKMPTKYSWQIHFNFDKMNEDGTPDTNWNLAVANEAFRLSWYYGLDLRPQWKRTNAINPMSCENNAYTMKGLCYTSDGTDYTELVRQELGLPENNGETPVRLDKEKAEQYKKQAMEELTALGVTFPVEIDYYIQGSNQNMLDSANVLKQTFSDCLGDDFVKLNILTYVQSSTQEVYNAKKHSMVVNGWGADYGDPQNYMIQEVMGNDNAFYAKQYSYIDDVVETEATKNLLDTYAEFTRMVEEAGTINDDLDARYQAFAKAEAYMIQHALCFPHYYDVGWCLTKVNPYSKMNSMFGSVNGKMKNWETNSEGYTTEEMEAIAEAYHAA